MADLLQTVSPRALSPDIHRREKPNIPASEKLAYPVPEACALAGFSRSKLYELISSGELRTVKRAGRRLVLRTDLTAFLAGEAA